MSSLIYNFGHKNGDIYDWRIGNTGYYLFYDKLDTPVTPLTPATPKDPEDPYLACK